MNPHLALLLAWRSLLHHRGIAAATVLGIALGLTVAGAILIVDHNSIATGIHGRMVQDLDAATREADPSKSTATAPQRKTRILRISFERGAERREPERALMPGIPTQSGRVAAGVAADTPVQRRGEEDYQAMRLAVRLASMMAFAVGAVIVFYTMRFSVASRSREFSLVLCLGEYRFNLGLTLTLEALLLGSAGTLLGLLLAFVAAHVLIDAGISTTGRVPRRDLLIPVLELALLAGLSVLIALLGVLGPLVSIWRMRIIDVLQPRFIGPQIDRDSLHPRGLVWMLPPLLAATWIAVRPFMRDWLSVVEFFVVESSVAAALAMLTLWLMAPVLRVAIAGVEWALKGLLPMDALLVGRRLRLTSRTLVFSVAGVTLVFSLITALDDITRALKAEIDQWAREAVNPYVFFERHPNAGFDPQAIPGIAVDRGLHAFRLSSKVGGEFPLRVVSADDANTWLAEHGRPLLGPGKVIVTPTLAARFDLATGDRVLVTTDDEVHRFVIVGVAADLGFFADDGQYVDLKSYFLFADGNPLFASNLDRSVGRFLAIRSRSGQRMSDADLRVFQGRYGRPKVGRELSDWQLAEIDRDFLIFDFILALTVILAAVGVANTILIQVHARRREFSVLRTLGVSSAQTARLLLVEGAIVGTVSALMALLLGHALGAISVAFLDRFTLFEYSLQWSWGSMLGVSLLALLTCCAAAIYPALVANRISSAESLHDE